MGRNMFKFRDFLVSKSYRNYLRCENIKRIVDSEYKIDYSYSTYILSDISMNYNNNFGNPAGKLVCPMCGYELKIFEGCYCCDNCAYCASL